MLLNYKESKHKLDNDILVYNSTEKIFVQTKKDVYLSNVYLLCDNLKKELNDLKKENEELRKQIITIAKILKEKI